jgi:hypothetical protein
VRIARWLMLGAALVAALGGTCRAAALRPCERPAPTTAEQQDRTLRFAAIVKAELERSGRGVALIARSGIDLTRFGFRMSHAGVALKASRNGPWSVRQLYYVCDDALPRLFDQGMAGFLLGADAVGTAHVSVIFLPEPAAGALERTALDDAHALALLGAHYSANAHAFSVTYQNCNQWVAEMLAASWAPSEAGDNSAPRARAQRWLREQGYVPSDFEVGNPTLMWLAGFTALLHDDDHPAADVAAMRFRVSMPASIESFVASTVPGATRIEFCRDDRHAVIHRGWDPIAEGCRATMDDQSIGFD